MVPLLDRAVCARYAQLWLRYHTHTDIGGIEISNYLPPARTDMEESLIAILCYISMYLPSWKPLGIAPYIRTHTHVFCMLKALYDALLINWSYHQSPFTDAHNAEGERFIAESKFAWVATGIKKINIEMRSLQNSPLHCQEDEPRTMRTLLLGRPVY